MGIPTHHLTAARRPGSLRHAGLSFALLAALAAGQLQAAPVATAEARLQATAGQRTLDGALQAVRQATVASQVGGNLVSLSVKAGDRVRVGQLIAQMDERESVAALQRSDAGMAQAQAEARNARQVAERSRSLRAQGFVSQAALDQAETALLAAQAGEQQAQAGRSQALLQRGFARVLAPFDAVVLATHLDVGDLATPGRPIATLYAPGALRAVVMVPASMAAAARSATPVQLLLADGQRLSPSASSLLPGTDPVSQTVEWRLDLPNAAGSSAGLMPGQALRVVFDAAPAATTSAPTSPLAGGLLLPPAALLRRGELQAVYVAQGQRFVLRAVRTGADLGPAGVVVLAGLKAGERYALDAVAAGLADATPTAATGAPAAPTTAKP